MSLLTEHVYTSSPVESHLGKSTGNASQNKSRILEHCEDPGQLLTFDALYITKRQLTLKQRDENRHPQVVMKTHLCPGLYQ